MRIPFLLILSFFAFNSIPVLAQDLDEILASQEIDTMLYSGPKDNRINWVIQNRGNSFEDKNDFTTLYREDLLLAFEHGHALAQEPYSQYRNFFNLYTSWWPEALDDSNGWSWQIINELRDALFLPWSDEKTGWVTWFSTTRGGGGGGAGLERDKRVGNGKMFGMGFETFLHEFGHTMPGLLDEYSSDGSWSGGACWETGNTSGQLTRDEIPWRRWIKEGTPIPTPYTAEYLNEYGAFEGAMTNYFGCHRPSARSCFMGAGGFGEDYGLTLCSPCKQRVICYLYQYVNVIENPLPAEEVVDISQAETIKFTVDLIKPEPNTQQTAWILNGKTIARNTDEIELTFESCKIYELKFTVLDTNELVRYDPKFDHLYPKPYQEHVWTINNSSAGGVPMIATPFVKLSDCSGADNGEIFFNISGGQGPYTLHSNGIEYSNPMTELAAGDYQVEIVDANGCSLTLYISVESERRLDPKICSTFDGVNWILRVEDENYIAEELFYEWSVGSAGPSIEISEDGFYEVEVTNADGCVQTRRIEVLITDSAITVDETIFPSLLSKPSGKIYLEISGGRRPYSVTWEDLEDEDLTSIDVNNILSSGTTWNHYPEYAFDDALNTKWLHAVSNDAYIGYRFDEPTIIGLYAITSADDVPERDPKHWEFQGSMDGMNWNSLDVQNDHIFTQRYQKELFIVNNNTAYTHYRIWITENYGDIATQIQEVEFIGGNSIAEYSENKLVENDRSRTKLAGGLYRYTIKDKNGLTQVGNVRIDYSEPLEYENLNVIADGNCQVRIENPKSDFEYFWFADKELTKLISFGETFQAQQSGNYYVAAVEQSNQTISENIRGFAVQVAEKPEIELIDDVGLAIVDPREGMEYLWYDSRDCSAPILSGSTFDLEEAGTYYVAAQKIENEVAPIDPTTIGGMLIKMDASDINGDGLRDDPAPSDGSLYDWLFTPNNGITDRGWFAYRSNHQNGLGVADFATIWLQGLDEDISDYQTIIMAYEENPISFPERAPFEGLSRDIPRHADESQIYSSNAPTRTKEGSTYLNGELIDPFSTENPLSFCVLATVMSEKSPESLFYTDTHWEGKIGELLLFDRALDESEIKGVSEFLKQKWIRLANLESPKLSFEWTGTSVANEDVKDVLRPSIYPNPAFESIHLYNLEIGSNIQLFDQQGRKIRSVEARDAIMVLDIAEMAAGFYFVQIFNQRTQTLVIEKFVKG